MTVTARKLFIILAVALSVSAVTIGIVIVWTNLSDRDHANGEREINDNEPAMSAQSGLGSSIHFPNPLRMLASSLSSDRVASASKPPSETVHFEERHIYVVDMFECDKTFAALKYKLWVRVPAKTPPFRQRPNPNIKPMSQQQHRQIRPNGYLTNQQWQQQNQLHNNGSVSQRLPRSNVGSSPRSGDRNANDEQEEETTTTASAPSDDQQKSTIRRILEALMERRQRRVSESSGSQENSDEPDQMVNLRESSAQIDDLADNESAASGSALEEDPIEVAASELDLLSEEAAPSAHLKSSILNRTLVDCFMVDTEKRYQQKTDIERRYRHMVTTRQVGANLMNEGIEKCTRLIESMSLDKITIIKLNENNTTSSANSTSSHSAGFLNPFQPIGSSTFLENILSSALAPMEQQQQQQQQQQAAAASNSITTTNLQVQSPNQVNEKHLANSRIIDTNYPNASNNTNQTTRGLSNYVSAGVSMINGIVPNTLWCGLGDRASNYSELGTEYRVDACCRAHDHCPVRLRPFSNDYGLMNWSVSTRSHCSCDSQFNQCLARANSTLANVIRVIYFRFVGLQCIELLANQHQQLDPTATEASNSDVRQSSLLSTATGFVFG